MARIVLEVPVEASGERVAAALTTAEGLASWWTDDVEFDGTVGGLMRLGFPIAPMPFELRLEEASSKRVRWSSIGEFPPHWQGTEVVWTLTAADGSGVVLHFAHEGWTSDEGPLPQAAYVWGQLLGLLKRYAETGERAPLFRRS